MELDSVTGSVGIGLNPYTGGPLNRTLHLWSDTGQAGIFASGSDAGTFSSLNLCKNNQNPNNSDGCWVLAHKNDSGQSDEGDLTIGIKPTAGDKQSIFLDHVTGSLGVGVHPYTGSPLNRTMHLHSDKGQAALFLSGLSDGGATYSALYLCQNNTTPTHPNNNCWTVSHKNDASSAHANNLAIGYNNILAFSIDDITGNIGINMASPTEKLDVNGNIRAEGTVFANGTALPSDRQLKKNIKPLPHALDKIAKLQGVKFNWKKDGQPDIGLIAQEVETVFPELVLEDSSGVKHVDYSKLVPVLIEAIKELKTKCEQ